MRHARCDHSLLSPPGIEHLLQPSEAPVWACAALVRCLHHCHWFGPLLQVGSLKHFWFSSMCLPHHPPPVSSFLLTQFASISMHIAWSSCWSDRLSHPSHPFFLTQKKNHVPEHCECHRANDRWEGGYFLCVQQPHQEGNRHVRDLLQQDIKRLLSQLCPVYFKMYFCGLKKAAADLCKWSASVAGCHLLSPVCLAPPGPWWWQAVTCLL